MTKQDQQCNFNNGYWDGYNETMRGHMDRNRNVFGVDMNLHTNKLYAAGWRAGKSAALNGETVHSSEPAFKAYLASIPKKSKTKVLPLRTDLKI